MYRFKRQMLHEPAKRSHKSMLGSLPCLFTLREESAFGYMTKVTLVPWSTARVVRSGSRYKWPEKSGLPNTLGFAARPSQAIPGIRKRGCQSWGASRIGGPILPSRCRIRRFER
jgi:hypothetical protein